MGKKKSGILKKKAVRADGRGATEAMVAALAHEIKNPLNSMKGAGQYLYDKYSGQKEIRVFTKIIIDEADRLEKYLNEFMSFSRGVKLNRKRVNAEIFLMGIIMFVKHGFPADIRIIKKKKKIPDIYIDQEQMRQVMVNIFSNAKDALKTVENPRTEVILDSHEKNMVIILKDNGAGISKDDIADVFIPFFSTKESGLGIGLAICRSIVRKHGGNIKVKNGEPRGTEVIITLPVYGVEK